MRPLTVLVRLPRTVLMGLVRTYRLLFSPWVGQACRFEPTCSRYALEALEKHGALGGTVMTTWRLLRCHPFCAGGHDPVPDNAPWARRRSSPDSPTAAGLFTGLLQRDAPPGTANANNEPTPSKTSS
jgi:putative membrane protein insertion efficiency factor